MIGARPCRRALRWLPCAVLVAVAVHQIALARTAGLSPWSGGGFGMFASTDAGSTRHLHAFARRPGLRRELQPPRALKADLRRALTLPRAANLRRLARKLAAIPTPDHGPATSIEVQVWHTRYDPVDLAPAGRIVKSLDVPLADD